MLSIANPAGPADETHLDRVFRALGDRTRRGILNRLAQGPASISDLAEPFDMSLPAVSKHLRVLERAGLVRRRIDGRVHRCSLSALPLEDAQRWVMRYRRFWEETLESLSDYLDEEPDRA
jgi:DNA-binding transcriptional ArsR family regulator